MRLGRHVKYQYYKMLRVKDSPAKVAQGVGLGFAMDFAIPIPLVSIFIALVVARIAKMNSLAAVLSATFLKPFWPAIVALNVYVQTLLVQAFPFMRTLIVPRPEGVHIVDRFVNKLLAHGVPYLVAGLVNGATIFLLSYLGLYYALQYRAKKLKHRRALKHKS